MPHHPPPDAPRTLSAGTRVYNYGRMGARPDEVLFWRSRNRVIVKIKAAGSNPRQVEPLDRHIAELTTLAVARSVWRSRFSNAEVVTYLVYEGPVHVAVEVTLPSLRAAVDDYLAESRRDDPRSVPVHVVAYAFLQRSLCKPRLAAASATHVDAEGPGTTSAGHAAPTTLAPHTGARQS
ncbi:MAG: hypothetical protein AAGA68_25355 [Pseudomonadota bacterium]